VRHFAPDLAARRRWQTQCQDHLIRLSHSGLSAEASDTIVNTNACCPNHRDLPNALKMESHKPSHHARPNTSFRHHAPSTPYTQPVHVARTNSIAEWARRFTARPFVETRRHSQSPHSHARNHQRSHSGKDAHPPRRITLRYTVICTGIHALNSTRDETHFPPPRAHALNSPRVMHTVALVDTGSFADAVRSPARGRP
jgi:hypothetical protein